MTLPRETLSGLLYEMLYKLTRRVFYTDRWHSQGLEEFPEGIIVICTERQGDYLIMEYWEPVEVRE